MKSIFFVFIICCSIFMYSCRDNNPDDSNHIFDFEILQSKDNGNVIEDNNRVLWQKPNTVLEELGDLSDKTVADLGAGTGFFSFRMLPRAGKVVALEIDTAMISFMNKTKSRLSEELSRKFEIRLVKYDDPGLATQEVDYILIVNTVAYLPARDSYFQKLKNGLKENGKIVIIDFKKKQSEVGPEDKYRLEYQIIVDQLEAAGFSDIDVDLKTLDYQYIITAGITS